MKGVETGGRPYVRSCKICPVDSAEAKECDGKPCLLLMEASGDLWLFPSHTVQLRSQLTTCHYFNVCWLIICSYGTYSYIERSEALAHHRYLYLVEEKVPQGCKQWNSFRARIPTWPKHLGLSITSGDSFSESENFLKCACPTFWAALWHPWILGHG